MMITLSEDKYLYLPVQDLSIEPKWDERLQLVLYPVLTPYGERIGYVRRHYKELNNWWSGAKALNLVDNHDKPWAHFPLGQDYGSGNITIVEDIPSAEAVAKYTPACALCGVGLRNEHVQLFQELGIHTLNVCLDNDAISQGIRIKREYELTFKNINVIFVNKDPKNMTKEELQEVFNYA